MPGNYLVWNAGYHLGISVSGIRLLQVLGFMHSFVSSALNLAIAKLSQHCRHNMLCPGRIVE